MIWIFWLLSIISMWHSTNATDAAKWCSQSLCKGKHPLCNDKGLFYSSCPRHATALIPMTTDFITLIEDKHNEYRNKFALGSATHSKASRMAVIRWDEGLAKIAEGLVRRCQPSRDQCAATEDYASAEVSFTVDKYFCMVTKRAVLQRQLNRWFDPQHQGDSDPNIFFTSAVKNLQHSVQYYQVVRDRADRLGCALIEYIRPSLVHQLLKCVYNCGVKVCTNESNPVYEHTDGDAGEACETGMSHEYDNLCSPQEPMRECS
ncbi:hypothetical protein KR018_007901, partial [Drosophila ironensis]